MTTTDQDRRIADRSIELGAASVLVGDVGPASTRAIVASYQDRDGGELDVERIREDGTTTEPSRWLAYVRRWRRYAGRMTAAAIATLALAAPAAAQDLEKMQQPAEPCSVRACAIARFTLDPGESARVTTRQRFGVWDRTQDVQARLVRGGRDVLNGVETINCGAYFYGAGLVVRATMPGCTLLERSTVKLRITNARPRPVRVRLAIHDIPANDATEGAQP